MKTAGIIAEYNPFHKGHAFHISETKRITGADSCIVVMSGDFVQRGEPAILDKYARTEMALAAGADLVIELPVGFASASAERFAYGAVSLLDSLGVTDVICCGCEEGLSLEEVQIIAGILAKEPEAYQMSLREQLKNGFSYPAAREKALCAYLTETGQDALAHKAGLSLSSPNAILTIEYAKALARLSSSIKLETIPRKGGYHSPEIVTSEHMGYSSATAVRKLILEAWKDTGTRDGQSLEQMEETLIDRIPGLEEALPSSTIEMIKREPWFMDEGDFSEMLGYRLWSLMGKSLTEYQDVTDDLAHRIQNKIQNSKGGYKNWETLSEQLKTRELTRSRIDRALLHILLDMKKSGMAENPLYARVLGFRQSSTPILKKIKENKRIPLVTNMAVANDVLAAWYEEQGAQTTGSLAQEMLAQDVTAAHLYELAKQIKYPILGKNEYTQEIIRYGM
jgi:predicted nucleotidyltransferase